MMMSSQRSAQRASSVVKSQQCRMLHRAEEKRATFGASSVPKDG